MLRSNSSQLVGGPSLPISPYPAQKGTEIAAHLVTDKRPDEEGWTPCFGGLLYRKWVRGLIAGYRDMAGNEAKVSNCCSWQVYQLTFPARDL
jgi:hypothetical protein